MLADWLETTGAGSLCDFGCGRLDHITGVPAITEGLIHYHGIDERAPLIDHHRRVFRWFHGEHTALEGACVERRYGRAAQILVLNDAVAGLCQGGSEQLFLNISQWTRWRFLLVRNISPLEMRAARAAASMRLTRVLGPVGWRAWERVTSRPG